MARKHGSQKVAQKSSKITLLPNASDKRTLLPSKLRSSKSGGRALSDVAVVGSEFGFEALLAQAPDNSASNKKRAVT